MDLCILLFDLDKKKLCKKIVCVIEALIVRFLFKTYSILLFLFEGLSQELVDGFASKPMLRHDTRYMVEKTYNLSQYLGFWGLFDASGTKIGFKIGSNIAKWSLEHGDQLTLSSIWSKSH